MLKADKKPDFENFLKVIRRDPTAKPVLFELFMCNTVYEAFSGKQMPQEDDLARQRILVEAFANAGYDYACVHACHLHFPTAQRPSQKTLSLNSGTMITDRASFESYAWPDPDAYDYSLLERIRPYLPENMKLMVMGPGGVLENVIAIMGYDNLCYQLYEDPALVQDVFDAVGSRLVRYYRKAAAYDSAGVIMSNDDWGFNTQTFLSVADMRRYVFPWHKKIVEVAHQAGLPALLHSCGYMVDIMDDVIDDMGFDARHSYEDNIVPVEESYRRWGDRIAILGGIDVDFLTRAPVDRLQERCRAMLELTRAKGGYALGSGNSIPESVPLNQYVSMLRTLVNIREV